MKERNGRYCTLDDAALKEIDALTGTLVMKLALLHKETIVDGQRRVGYDAEVVKFVKDSIRAARIWALKPLVEHVEDELRALSIASCSEQELRQHIAHLASKLSLVVYEEVHGAKAADDVRTE